MDHTVHHLHKPCLGNRTKDLGQQLACMQIICMLLALQNIVAITWHQRIHWHGMFSCNMRSEKGGSAQSTELACRLAAAASLSSCIISRAVTVLLASEAREFFWALDSLSFVCNQCGEFNVKSKDIRQGAMQTDCNSMLGPDATSECGSHSLLACRLA